MKRKFGPQETGHVVEEFYHGHVHVRICDDYCRDKTKEEVDAILARIARNALIALQPVLRKQKEEEESAEMARLAAAEQQAAQRQPQAE